MYRRREWLQIASLKQRNCTGSIGRALNALNRRSHKETVINVFWYEYGSIGTIEPRLARFAVKSGPDSLSDRDIWRVPHRIIRQGRADAESDYNMQHCLEVPNSSGSRSSGLPHTNTRIGTTVQKGRQGPRSYEAVSTFPYVVYAQN
jgi:hypothetical protein